MERWGQNFLENPVFKPTSRKETINLRLRDKNMHTFKLGEKHSNYEFYFIGTIVPMVFLVLSILMVFPPVRPPPSIS